MYEFKLPDLGEGIHEGEILHWHVNVGDQIKEDDPLVEVETDKAAVTIPSPKGGRVTSVSGAVGDTVAVGTVIAVIEEQGAGQAKSASKKADGERSTKETAVVSPAGGQTTAARAPAQSEPVAPALALVPSANLRAQASAQSSAATKSGPVPAAPATRRLARELGIDIRQVPPSQPGGRVTSDDVRRYAAGTAKSGAGAISAPSQATALAPAPAATPTGAADAALAPATSTGLPYVQLEPMPNFEDWGPVEREPVRSIRRKIAYKMATSMAIVPHTAHMDQADVTELESLRRRERQRRVGQPGEKLTLLAFVIKAVVSELRLRPQLNASLDPYREEIVYKRFYNIGFAADTDKGLIVPVIHNADQKSVVQIADELVEISAKARAATVDVAQLRGGTFTVTNVGSLGGTGMVPTINYPEVAILGLARAEQRPVVRDGQIVVRRILPMTLSFDHRIIDGAEAARFMSSLSAKLSDPSRLLLES